MTTPASPAPAPLIDAPKRRNRLAIAIVGVIVVLAVVGSVLFATGAFSGGGKAVRIGVVGASDPQWPLFVDAAKEQGIDVEIVNFSEYPQLNPALSEGEIDLNQFQHLVYLAQYNEGAGDDLTPVGATAIYPLGLYSQKHGSVDEIPRGGTVILPNDESNLARGLLLLQREGLLTLKGGGSSVSTLDDVDQAASKVTVKTVEAALTATSLPDADAVIINNDFITDAGLTADDALAQDDPSDPKALAYVNVFASRADDATNETYVKLARIFEDTPAVIDALVANSGGTAVPLKTPQDELRSLLTTTEKAVADQKAAR
ncbi:MetQ/NlpA family ABC transporter substrate-binding protein [Clavibacter sp. Sh2126]|uniref:MetQ/NlpA family ABC transporter substrate-binding protein n=1 Tax=unclassified Clavibacter TaxID=2626594 RepID=UPI0039E03942